MLPTIETLAAIAGERADHANMGSIIAGLKARGSALGLDQPHRLAHYLAQIAHESGRFRCDREIWGPTPAQQRYDTRTDLGNTPERDGDGFLFRGRTGIQITGRANTVAFRDWCRTQALNPPDFERDPDAMLTDPWEGLGPLWYWSTRALNRYADENDIEMITKRINGGLNGYADRIALYTRAALVLLGLPADDVRRFQGQNGLAVDGIAGPRTRAALHAQLSALSRQQPRDYADEGQGDTPPTSRAPSGLLAALLAALCKRT